MRYGTGIPVANVWEGDYNIPIVLKSNKADNAHYNNIEDELIPVAGGLSSVPLRQIASIEPSTEDGQLVRRNGIYTITVMSDLKRGENAMEITGKIQEKNKRHPSSSGSHPDLWGRPGTEQ